MPELYSFEKYVLVSFLKKSELCIANKLMCCTLEEESNWYELRMV